MRKSGLLALWALGLLLAGCGPGGGTTPAACTLTGSLTGERELSPSGCSPYRVEREFVIENTGRLTIQPGTTLEFAQDAKLVVEGHGVLKAVGTSTDKIAFLGAEPHRGYWSGVYLDHANSFDNELAFVEIEHAGGEGYWDPGAFEDYRAALVLEGDSRIKLKDVLIRNSGGSGVFADEEVDLAAFERVAITQGASFPLLVYARLVHRLDPASDFTGNDPGMDYVRVADWNGIKTATWKRLSVPYLVENELAVQDGELLTIEAGTRLVFEQDAGIFVEGHGGGLHAEGTATDKIVFTGLDAHAGYWCGLVFSDSNHSENLLEYAVVEYGGSGSCTQMYSSQKANVLVESAGSGSSQFIRIRNSEIRHSAGYGVVIASETDANDILGDNTFSDNVSGNLLVE